MWRFRAGCEIVQRPLAVIRARTVALSHQSGAAARLFSTTKAGKPDVDDPSKPLTGTVKAHQRHVFMATSVPVELWPPRLEEQPARAKAEAVAASLALFRGLSVELKKRPGSTLLTAFHASSHNQWCELASIVTIHSPSVAVRQGYWLHGWRHSRVSRPTLVRATAKHLCIRRCNERADRMQFLARRFKRVTPAQSERLMAKLASSEPIFSSTDRTRAQHSFPAPSPQTIPGPGVSDAVPASLLPGDHTHVFVCCHGSRDQRCGDCE